MIAESARPRRFVKPALLALYGILFLPEFFDRLRDIGGIAGPLAYTVLVLAALCGIIGAAYTANALLRGGLALLLFAASFVIEAYARSSLEFLTYGAFIDLITAAEFAGDAMDQNEAALWRSLPGPAVLLIAVAWPPRRRARTRANTPALAMPAALVLFTLLAFTRGGDGLKALPGGYAALSYAVLAAYERAAGDLGPRKGVSIAHVRAPLYRDIVLIVDESISGHYLDINHPRGVRSGLAEARPGVEIANFGVAASATNCSAGSNLVLRFAGTRDSYRRDIAVGPSLWDYAAHAGLETVYIDAQRSGGAMQNQMTPRERERIDRFIQFGGLAVRDRDMAVADRLAHLLGDGTASFILVNKVGAHFPIHDKFPDSHARYRPILPRGGFLDVTDTGSRTGFGGSQADWRRYRNSYRNTLEWSVGAFFDRLLERAELADALVIYTADHGQNLHEGGKGGTTTHCSVDPRPEEGAVPLVVLQGGAGALAFTPGGAASHYMIAPTLLAAMGYDREAVRARSGGALDEPSRDPATFNYLYNARLNREPRWREVDPAALAPVPDDPETGRPF